jgi:ADP-ribose pyrophosphatase
MSREYPQQPNVGVGVIIVRDGKVLVVQRGREPGAGTWAFPGGRLELGETLAEAAVREAREETGLEVEPGEVAAVVEFIDRDEQGKVRWHYVIVDLLATPVGGTLQPGDDSVAVRWIGLEEIETLNLAPRMARIIRKVLADSSQRSP